MKFLVVLNSGTTFTLDVRVVLLLLVLQLVAPLILFHLIGSLRSTWIILAHAEKSGHEVIAIRSAGPMARMKHEVKGFQFMYEILLRETDGAYTTQFLVYGDPVWGGFFDRTRFIEGESIGSYDPDEWENSLLSRRRSPRAKPGLHDDWSA